MKNKITIFLFISICLVSCKERSNIIKQDSLPIEVIEMAKNNVFDTITAIKTEKNLVIFENNNYKESIDLKNDEDGAFGAGIALGMLGLIVIIGLIAWISESF